MIPDLFDYELKDKIHREKELESVITEYKETTRNKLKLQLRLNKVKRYD